MMGWGNMMGGWGYGSGIYSNGWFGLLCMIAQIFFGIVLIVIAVKMFQQKSFNTSQGRSNDNALEILKMRYAKGEIDTEEFTRRKNELQ